MLFHKLLLSLRDTYRGENNSVWVSSSVLICVWHVLGIGVSNNLPYIGVSPSGKAPDFDSGISQVQVLLPLPCGILPHRILSYKVFIRQYTALCCRWWAIQVNCNSMRALCEW